MEINDNNIPNKLSFEDALNLTGEFSSIKIKYVNKFL